MCRLSSEELTLRRKDLIPGLFDQARKVEDVPKGLRLEFDAEAGLLARLAQVIEAEQGCCSFLRFSLTAEPHNGPVVLEITGPDGTGKMLRSL